MKPAFLGFVLVAIAFGAGPAWAETYAWSRYTEVGRRCLEKGDLDDAEHWYAEALQEATSKGAGALEIGLSHYGLGRCAMARSDFGRAAKIFSNTYQLLRQVQGAEAFQWTLAIQWSDAELALGNLGEARRVLQVAKKMSKSAESLPNRVTACLRLGAIEERSHRPQEAKQQYLEGLQESADVWGGTSPGKEKCLIQLYLLEDAAGNSSQAQHFLEAAYSVYVARKAKNGSDGLAAYTASRRRCADKPGADSAGAREIPCL